MEVLRSSCGIYNCRDCGHRLAGECVGCHAGNRQLRAVPGQECAVFRCVESRGIESCNDCREASCVLRRSVESICPLRGRFEKQRWWAGRMSRALSGRKSADIEATADDRISERVVNRLRWYLVALDSFTDEGAESVSSWQLAERVGVSAALIRKDLSKCGEFGTPSFGYRIDYLRERIRSIMGLDRPRAVVWVGACAFRHYSGALARLCQNNCQVVGVFDIEPSEIGGTTGGFVVKPVEQMPEALAGVEVAAAAIAVTGKQVQAIAATLVELGARAVLNMSGELLVLPDHVRVSSLDVAGELLELCYYC